MQLHHFETPKTTRYVTLGTLSSATRNIWFVCHGYGQLAEYFIQKFKILDESQNFVVAPEALSKFYLNGFDGRVGATWMTREDRLSEIKDYIRYLNGLYEHIFAQADVKPEDVNIIVLGFSQGTSTVKRWVYDQKIKFDSLVLWAGSFPPDVDYSITEKILGEKPIYYVYGLQDELIQGQAFEKQVEEIHKKGIHPHIITFEGKHELNEDVINKIAELSRNKHNL